MHPRNVHHPPLCAMSAGARGAGGGCTGGPRRVSLTWQALPGPDWPGFCFAGPASDCCQPFRLRMVGALLSCGQGIAATAWRVHSLATRLPPL